MANANTRTETQSSSAGPTVPTDDAPDKPNNVREPHASTTQVAAPAQTGGAVAVMSFEGDAGRGMEGATTESFAIPFLYMLQKGSPQVDEASGVALPGAKQGMLFDNVTGRMFDVAKEPVTVLPCAYRRVFLRWAPRDAGGGFKGELTPDQVAEMRTAGKIVEMDNRLYIPNADGSVNPKTCDVISDTRNHYVLLLDDKTGGWAHALISLASTQIKKSKNLMSALASVKLSGSQGMYTPASWANRVKITSVPEKNDKGNWMGWRFELAGMINRHDIYAAGKAFNESVRKGAVDVKYEDMRDVGDGDGGDPTTVNAATQPGKAGGSF